MGIDQVAEIFRTNMSRLVRDAATRNRLRQLDAAGHDPVPSALEAGPDDPGELTWPVRRVA